MTIAINFTDLPAIPLTGEAFKVNFGPKVPVTVSAGEGESGPSVLILTPPMTAPAGVGFMHMLSQDEAAQLGAAVYASMTTAGQLKFVAALGQSQGN